MYDRKVKDQKKKLKRRKKTTPKLIDPEEKLVLSKKDLLNTRVFEMDYEDGEYDELLTEYGY